MLVHFVQNAFFCQDLASTFHNQMGSVTLLHVLWSNIYRQQHIALEILLSEISSESTHAPCLSKWANSTAKSNTLHWQPRVFVISYHKRLM